MMIRGDELIKAPSVEVCRELAVASPESRKVTPKLRVSFHDANMTCRRCRA